MKRIYVLHIPKTGGLTLRSLLQAHLPPEKVFPGHHIDDLMAYEGSLDEFILFGGHFGRALLDRIEDLLTVCLLRDPVDRAVSHYRQIMRDPSHYDHDRMKSLGFERFLDDPWCQNLVTNYHARHLALMYDDRMLSWQPPVDPGRYPLRCLQDLFPIAKGLLRSGAYDTLERVDILGTTNTVHDTYRQVLARMGWQGEAESRHVNSAPGLFHLDPVVAERVRAVNDIDAELYSYALQGRCCGGMTRRSSSN